jgi:hypothetical protein
MITVAPCFMVAPPQRSLASRCCCCGLRRMSRQSADVGSLNHRSPRNPACPLQVPEGRVGADGS